jgi:hypothetical protein
MKRHEFTREEVIKMREVRDMLADLWNEMPGTYDDQYDMAKNAYFAMDEIFTDIICHDDSFVYYDVNE